MVSVQQLHKSLATSVLLLFAILPESQSQECCPCGSTDAECFRTFSLGRMDTKVSGAYDSTCATVFSDLKQFDNNSALCSANVLESTYSRCCDDATPDPDDYVWLAEVPTAAAGSDVGETACELDPSRCGNEVCHLCWRTNGFPEKWQTVTASLFIPGTPICRDLYYLGLAGAIPNRLCRPMQDYYEGPCGCPTEVSSGNGGEDQAIENDQSNSNEDGDQSAGSNNGDNGDDHSTSDVSGDDGGGFFSFSSSAPSSNFMFLSSILFFACFFS